MKTLAELTASDEPAWPALRTAIEQARPRARALPTTRWRGEAALVALQVTTGSALGAIAHDTGGLAVDHGWLRILGAGGPEMALDLLRANGLVASPTTAPGSFIVAVDVLGGIFALNGGALPGAMHDVCYLAPDTLAWEPLDLAYSRFVAWVLHGRVDEFYASFRWPGWEQTLDELPLDQGLHVLPPLFAAPEPGVPTSRKPVPIAELTSLTQDLARQMEEQGIKTGDKVQLKVEPE